MDWHHNNVRRGTASLMLNKVFARTLGRPLDRKAASEAEALLISSLKASPHSVEYRIATWFMSAWCAVQQCRVPLDKAATAGSHT